MRMKLPKPMHGWRAFLGEVGIIVLGVLLALAAQQMVDGMRWRSDVADFRAAVHDEMAEDLATYPFHARQNACIKMRLSELQRWLDRARAGTFVPLKRDIGIPSSLVIRTSAWDSRDPETLAHMPRQERLDIGYLYSEFANNEIHRLDERAAWIDLNGYNGIDRLTHEDQVKLQELIFRAGLRDRRMGENYDRFVKRAAELGVVPKASPLWPDPELATCQPILPEGRTA